MGMVGGMGGGWVKMVVLVLGGWGGGFWRVWFVCVVGRYSF